MNCRYVFEVNEVSKNSWNHNSQKLDEYFLFRRNRKKGPKQSLFFSFVMTMLVFAAYSAFFLFHMH